MRKYSIFLLLLLMLFALFGCKKNNDSNESITESINVDTAFEKEVSEMFTDRDYDSSYDVSNSTNIQLNGDSVICSSNKVRVDGSTITIIDEGTFIISGSLSNGKIIVDAQDTDKLQLVFNGVSITNQSFAPLYIVEADKVFVTLADNTTNELFNGGDFTLIDDNNVDGTVFSKQDLTFNGNGVLTITSPSGHGIVCKDDLVFTSGTYVITAANHGLDVNDSIRISNSNISITSGKDGMHSENSDDTTLGYIYIVSGNIDINAEDDGISSNSNIQIEGGNFSIITGPGYTTDNTSLKGLKAISSMLINGGMFEIDSYDDAVHSNLSIVVNGGSFNITTNDDGFHADEVLSISNGTINILKSYEGLEGLTINISGGNINLVASDDGINAAGGTDSSGFGNANMAGGPGGGSRPGDNFGSGNTSSNNGYIEISGGNIYIEASGDGIDSNGNLSITGGIIYVCGPTNGDTAVLDYDGTGIISGGEFYGSGAYMMAQTLNGSDRGVLGVSVGNQKAGSTVVITNSSGEVVASFSPELSYQIIIVSNDKIIKGESYTITIGSTSGNVTAQ